MEAIEVLLFPDDYSIFIQPGALILTRQLKKGRWYVQSHSQSQS